MKFEEIGRFGAYGLANQKRKELEAENVGKHYYIFKDLTNGPFTSFRHDQYVVGVEKNEEDSNK